jgi:hypothetical protein
MTKKTVKHEVHATDSIREWTEVLILEDWTKMTGLRRRRVIARAREADPLSYLKLVCEIADKRDRCR